MPSQHQKRTYCPLDKVLVQAHFICTDCDILIGPSHLEQHVYPGGRCQECDRWERLYPATKWAPIRRRVERMLRKNGPHYLPEKD